MFSASHRTDQTEAKSVYKGELTIPKFYAGKNVFVTGVTGFIGKVLVEKLLRCCPDIGIVYCLMRPKNNMDVTQRFSELTACKVFDKLRSEQPEFEKKIVPVCGDIIELDLGISEEDARMLQDKIHVVFHSAATIRFDEPLKVAMKMNVVAVQQMIKLCRTFKHLEAFVHVSTAFANCDRSHIEETIYKPTVEPQQVLDVLEWMDDDMVDLITRKLLRAKPNTYTFSKHLAEWVLLTHGAGLPIAIVRPSIVGAAWKEPFPGWVDNFNGPSGMAVAYGKGILRSMKGLPSAVSDIIPVDLPINVMFAVAWYTTPHICQAYGKGILRSMKGLPSAVSDIIPVDLPINVMIAVAWYTAVARPRQLMVYHSTTSALNPYTWGELEDVMTECFKRTPLDSCFRRPRKLVLTSNSYVHDYFVFVSHLIPAYMMDLAFRVMGKKPRMVKVYRRLHKAIDTLTFFTSNSWTWDSNNLDIIQHQLSPEDLKTFFIDPRPLHWPSYLENYCLGAKQYLLNEDLAGVPTAKAHLRMLRNIRYLFNTLVVVALWRALIARSEIARNVWYLIVKLAFKFVSYFGITSSM
ncbi:hypothetical protein ACOMHN_004735 [Nucella lapillus]